MKLKLYVNLQVIASLALLYGAAFGDESATITVTLSTEARVVDGSGRLLVFCTQNPNVQPMRSLNWFRPEPIFGIDVVDFQPGQSRVIDDQADGFPSKLSELPTGKYFVQAIFDQDIYFPNACDGPGNVFCQPMSFEIEDGRPLALSLELNQTIPDVTLTDREFVKFVQRPSPLLTKFFGREFIDRCAVILPATYYSQPEKRYPVYYEVTGFGGNLRAMTMRNLGAPREPAADEVEFIRVLLTGECKWGHHVYANSQTNGPRGDVLVTEMISYIDSEFRTVAAPQARFVGGHSSGGWSSLWLQVNYPEVFGGVWSSSPDPVDFRDFQQIDLYHLPPLNVYVDEAGKPRPLARRGTTPVLMYRDFVAMDDVLGRGGQMRSFEAVFSPLGPVGLPRRCWNRQTGVVDPEVAEAWKAYDISLILKERWPELAPKLVGKLHVVMGDLDTFYLEGATKLLAERLKELGSDAEVIIVPNADHSSVITSEVRSRRTKQMAEAYLKYFDLEGKPHP